MDFAELNWMHGHPYSLDFDDVYYSIADGFAETEYVFIQHNQLDQRFAQRKNERFTIIETGFGTGLNFLSTAQQFLSHAPTNSTLRFISIERHPLTFEDLTRSHQQWPMFQETAKALQTQYIALSDGLNAFYLCQNRIQLDLWIGDISECLPQIETPANAWFLDGFAPAKNSSMWSESLYQNIALLSQTGTTFATFTSAGQVRRQLAAVGFDVKKAAGFGKKREMLYGQFQSHHATIKL